MKIRWKITVGNRPSSLRAGMSFATLIGVRNEMWLSMRVPIRINLGFEGSEGHPCFANATFQQHSALQQL